MKRQRVTHEHVTHERKKERGIECTNMMMTLSQITELAEVRREGKIRIVVLSEVTHEYVRRYTKTVICHPRTRGDV